MTTPRKPSKKGFAEVMAEMLRAQGKTCAICDYPDRADVEAAKANGVPFRHIAKALQKLGIVDKNVTVSTAASRVSEHFETHMEDTDRIITKETK